MMEKHVRLLLLLICLSVKAGLICAQEQFVSRYNITYVTMDNGLLHNFIDDIYKDSQGFLWISTGGGGLSRYDGYEFIHYTTNTPRVSLKSNFIKNVCEDHFGRLWIVSEGGIDILSLSTLQQVIPQGNNELLLTLIEKPAVTVIKDSLGCIWIYCGDSLYKITFDSKGEIHRIFSFPASPLTVQSVALCDIDEDGNIWAGIGNSVVKLFEGEGAHLKAVPVSPGLVFDAGIFISAILMKENEVWIGTNFALIRYNRNEEVIKRYEHERNNARSLSQSYITDLAITNDKQLLIATLRGLNVYNPMTDDFEQILQNGKFTGSNLNSNFLNCMVVDNDIVWIGTETGGIDKMTPRKLSVRNYIYNEDNPSSISRNPVNAIYEDAKGTLWVGTVEGGLNRKTKGSEQFTHYTSDSSSRLAHNSVSALAVDADNHLWVGTWGEGISLLDPDHPERPAIKQLSPRTYPGFPINFIGSLCYDPINKGMWIGSNAGIYFYESSTNTIFSLLPDEAPEHIHGSIGAIIDADNQLWMGCIDGVYMIDLNSRSGNQFNYKHLKYKLDEPDSRLIERISCFHLSGDGTLWLGSNGYGIYKHVRTEGADHYISYTTEQGLINNNVCGILEDERGRLWISTKNGLSCFDTTANQFINYTKEDGLIDNQFYWNAYCRSANGLLYFGGISGLTAIEASSRKAHSSLSKVVLTRLNIMNEEIFPGKNYIDTSISLAGTLHLHERDKSFSLEFSALNFEQRTTAVYKYRLLGFDDQWVEVPATRRFASYTNLPPGKYTFQVKYTPEGESANIPVTELSIVVSPFFYKTPWFIWSLLLLIGCSIVYFYKQRIRTLQSQKELLHHTVEQRTSELMQQKLVLEEQKAELSRQNDMLTEQNEKITRQKTQLVRMSKKVQELTVDKLSFFTNITHEFRTPITLIMGPIERALKLSYNPQVIEQLSFVERNSKYLLSLVNQLMDFRKVESGKLEIVKTKGDFLKFADSLVIPFEAFAGERNISIRKFYRLAPPDILFDPDAMQKVITNLLSNAIKFTPNGGSVSMYIASYTEKESGKEKLYISIKDTGTGIAEEDLSKIFNRFYQSGNHVKYPVYGQSGTGIGLYLARRIVQMHNGTIKARNNRKAGSAFSITLPLTRVEGPVTQLLASQNLGLPSVDSQFIPTHFSPNRLTILIVEDNADMRSYIRSILSEQYNILEAGDGAEALNILSSTNIDFIVSDLMMPVMDGIELSRRVKENFAISHIPFLMLTAKTSQETRIESYRTGVDEYLLKPFNEELLLTRISNILENRKRYQRQFAMQMDVQSLNIQEESSDKKFLDRVMEVIKENYKNSYYEVSDFVEIMGVSKSLLNKKMQSLTGQSTGQFIRNYRLNIARELIDKNRVTKNMNISEIAYEVGFNDPKYFTRCFTKRFNIPPSSLLESD